ncbi:Huntingtin [Geodia barretti]|nr:Huntingtin [Geodia barretti]
MSTGEGPADPGLVSSPQASGVKVLETLKKHVFEHSDAPSKTLSSREVCSSFSDLTAAVFSSSQRANSGVVVSGAIELLVHACSNQDRAIRLAGQENLHKLVKKLQSTHLSKLLQDLFHELKKNGSARSLSVALEVFAALFPRTRPSRRQALSQSLLPVLLRLLARDEEGLHESLQDGLSHILPTLTPFLSTTNNQLLMSAVLDRLPASPASFRRMAASTLHSLCVHSKSPQSLTSWLVGRMINIGCQETATEQTCQGILLTLQNMAGDQDIKTLNLMKQVYGLVLSCMMYRDGNTTVAAMETMNSLLLASSPALSRWLMTAQPSHALASKFWMITNEGEVGGDGQDSRQEKQDSSSDAHSLREDINDAYFGSDQEPSPPATAESSPVTSDAGSAVVQMGYFAVRDGPTQPLSSLVLYLTESVLVGKRVSALSVGLACLTSCADLAPSLLPSLSPYLPFTVHPDPKLKSRSAKLLAVLLRALLRESRGEASSPLVSEAAAALHSVLTDSSPVVLKAVCESLRICLPSLAASSQPKLAVELVEPLLAAASSSSYWLAKVELLRTLACLPLTALALSLPSLPHSLLSLCVFPLLGDTDHRVRTAAAEAVSLLVPSLQLTSDQVLAHAHWEVSREFPPLHSSTPQLSLASVGMHSCKITPPTPLGLQHFLWFLVCNISSSENHSLQRGCLEALHMLCSVFPPASMPQAWGCDCHIPSLLPTTLSLLTASQLAWTVQGQQQLLDVSSSLFLSCSLSAMDRLVQSGQPPSSSPWAALGDSELSAHAAVLLRHVGRLLAVFVHVLEGREPETRETKRMAAVSPKKAAMRDSSPIRSSPAKPKVIIENLQRAPLIPRDGLGQFSSSQPHLKILDTCRSAYTNYQVSLARVGEDKFSRLLQSTHNLTTILMEVALAADVSKHVEELMSYFTITFTVDPSGALLCVQQLLNALFGMNAAAQHTPIHSPYLSSLPFELHSLQR